MAELSPLLFPAFGASITGPWCSTFGPGVHKHVYGAIGDQLLPRGRRLLPPEALLHHSSYYFVEVCKHSEPYRGARRISDQRLEAERVGMKRADEAGAQHADAQLLGHAR